MIQVSEHKQTIGRTYHAECRPSTSKATTDRWQFAGLASERSGGLVRGALNGILGRSLARCVQALERNHGEHMQGTHVAGPDDIVKRDAGFALGPAATGTGIDAGLPWAPGAVSFN